MHFLKGVGVREATTEAGWRALLAPRLVLTLCVLLGGVLLHSMNVLITATLLPSVVAELGGANLMSWPTTAFVASSIIAASGTSLVSGRFGNRRHSRAAPSSTRPVPCCVPVRARLVS